MRTLRPSLSPSLLTGGEGTQTAPAHSSSPSPGAERAGARWGQDTPLATRCREGADRSPLPRDPATRKLRALWISAFHLGITRERSDEALAAWIERHTGLDAAGASPETLARAARALEAWLARAAGVD